MSIRGLAELVLWVHDLEASLAFYRDLLGLRLISSPARPSPAFLRAGDGVDGVPAMLVLVQLPTDSPPFATPRPLHHLALHVGNTDFATLKDRLVRAGYTPRDGRHPVIPSLTLYVNDPDGNEVEFIAPE